jgi:hypothetical protein
MIKTVYTSDSVQNKIVAALKKAGFAEGGFASKINKVISDNHDDGIATIQRGELILDKNTTKDFSKFIEIEPKFLSIMDKLTANNSDKILESLFNNVAPITYDTGKVNNTSFGDLNFTINAPNVTDSESFIRELKTPRVKEILQHTVLDEVLGKGSLNVNKY